jgi:photosystem II stability/assembly factor-like uncharacterized protein
MKTTRIFKHTLILLGLLVFAFSCENTVKGFDPNPTIATVQPNAASPTDTILMLGGNFSTEVKENIIEFGGGFIDTSIAATTNSVQVVVPVGAQDGHITLTVNGVSSESISPFDVLNEVTITGVLPPTVSTLDTITINGIYFDRDATKNVVTIGGENAEVVRSETGKSLKVVVSGNTPFGLQDIVVEAHEQIATFSGVTVSATPPFYFSKIATSNTNRTLNKVSIVDKQTAYIVGSSGTILKTINGGETWTNIKNGLPSVAYDKTLRDVHAIDSDNILVCGSSGVFVKSTNGGSSWTPIDVDTTERLRRMHFINDTEGWMVGSGGLIYKTTDGGNSWTKQSSGTTISLYGVFFLNANTGYVVGDDGVFLQTTDGGAEWNLTDGLNAAKVDDSFKDLTSVIFKDAQNGWIVGDNNVLLATTNGGTTWTNQKLLLADTGDDINDITIMSNGHIIAVADDRQTLRSEDDGATWVISDRLTDIGTGIAHIEGIDSFSDIAIAAGAAGVILQ